MIKRIDRMNNVEIGPKVHKGNTKMRYRKGFKWIPRHIRGGRPVRAHYARIGKYNKDQVIIERSRRYGWDRGPVYIREDKAIESYRKNNDPEEHKQ